MDRSRLVRLEEREVDLPLECPVPVVFFARPKITRRSPLVVFSSRGDRQRYYDRARLLCHGAETWVLGAGVALFLVLLISPESVCSILGSTDCTLNSTAWYRFWIAWFSWLLYCPGVVQPGSSHLL